MSEIDYTVDNTVLTLMNGEDSGWFKDSDASLSSSYSDGEIDGPHKGQSESETESSDSGKGRLTMRGEITLLELTTGDGDDGIQKIESA